MIPAPPPRSESDDRSTSGGLWALGGYFYQFVGGACRAVRTFEGMTQEPHRQGQAVVFSFEKFDQDVVEEFEDLTAKDAEDRVVQRRLIQYKYSAAPEKHPIQVDELLEIVSALKTSQQKAELGKQAPTEFIVITNRLKSQKVEDAIKSSLGWKMPGPTQARIPTLDDTSKTKTGKPTKNRKWTKNDIEILKKVQWKIETLEEHRGTLEQRGRLLGILPAEISSRVDALIGRLFAEVSRGFSKITAETLDRAFTGLKEGRILTANESRRLMREDFDEFLRDTNTKIPTIVRAIEPKLRDAMRQRALIFVWGEGGNGKTTLLSRLLQGSATQSVHGADGAVFGVACCAVGWADSALSTYVGRWRGDVDNHHTTEGRERALRRLGVAAQASPGFPCVLHLGIDAVDEVDDYPRRPEVDNLINEFWKRDRALTIGQRPQEILLVSCRADPERLLSKQDPYFSLAMTPDAAVFEVGEFSGSEFLEVADNNLSVSHRVTLEANESYDGYFPSGRVPLSAQDAFAASFDAPSAEVDGIIEDLHHPTLWRCFTMLSEDDQELVCEGDFKATETLCGHLVRWFLRKTRVRCGLHSKDIDRQGEQMLRLAARSLHTNGKHLGGYEEDWLEPARKTGINLEVAKLLHDEAQSSGLIVIPAVGRWQWRHSFMQAVLTGENA